MLEFLMLIMAVAVLVALVFCGRNAMSRETLADQKTDGDEAQETSFDPMTLMPLDEIFQIEDKTDLVIALNRYLCEKCEFDKNMAALSKSERIIYITFCLEAEVNNGGFSQFFFNSSGAFANELVYAFAKIGAVKTAEICKKAVSVYGDSVPLDREEREELLDNEENKKLLNECDNAFYEYEEDLTELMYTYVLENRAEFT